MGTANKRKKSVHKTQPQTQIQKTSSQQQDRKHEEKFQKNEDQLQFEDEFADVVEQEFPPSDLDKDSDDDAEIGANIPDDEMIETKESKIWNDITEQ